MKKDEFQKKYHEYMTTSEEDAKAEANKVNEEGIIDGKAVAVHFPGLGWCLMLETAHNAIQEMGIV